MITPLITNRGMSAVFNSTNDGLKATITHVVLGDGAYTPVATQVTLHNEKARHPIAQSERLGDNIISVECVCDSAIEFWVREVGFLLSDGTMLAVWSNPTTPLAYKSIGTDLLLSFELALTSLPSDSIVAASTGVSLNLALANDFTAMAVGTLDIGNSVLEVDNKIKQLRDESVSSLVNVANVTLDIGDALIAFKLQTIQ